MPESGSFMEGKGWVVFSEAMENMRFKMCDNVKMSVLRLSSSDV